MIANAIYDCDVFGDSEAITHPDELTNKHKLLILHGGEDISPSIYREVPRKTHASALPSKRDIIEIALFRKAIELGVPVLGICRGAQLVCCLEGGSLYQDVPHHAGHPHKLELAPDLKTGLGQVVWSNSYHHQMMIPKGGEVLAWVGPHGCERFKTTKYTFETIREPEIVYWKDHKVLAVQGHPEWDDSPNGIYALTSRILSTYFGI